jgi:hypothetical protein
MERPCEEMRVNAPAGDAAREHAPADRE